MSREVLSLLLEREGFTVECAMSGDAALVQLRTAREAPDLVLVDLQMPGLAGPALAEAMRRLCPPETLVLAMSGSSPQPSTMAAFDGFLLKPFQPQQLIDLLTAQRTPKVVAAGVESLGADTPSGPAATSNPVMSSLPSHQARSYPIAAAAPASGGPELDERIYRQLYDAMPVQQLRVMYTLCLDDVRKRILDMRVLAGHHDGDQFVRQAHAIKGGCGMLGASELYTMASRLERVGLEAAGLDGAQGVNPLDELDAACNRLERILGTRT